MQWTSFLAIYMLVWVMCAFVMLPFGIRTHDELGMDKTLGQADSAPANFRPWQVVIRATILAAVVTGLFALNYTYGWITPEDLGIYTGR
jgi:predicted secreted protein